MKNTQNQKISQIKNETLVVGIDVAKETHYARAFDYRGIELARLLKFSNTAEGFKLLDQWMQDICKQKGKTEIVAGFEPTGHYWFVLGDHLKRQGHKLAIVNPFHVNVRKNIQGIFPETDLINKKIKSASTKKELLDQIKAFIKKAR
jgi:transposase